MHFLRTLLLYLFIAAKALSISAQEVSVKLTIPDSVISGESFVLKVKIGKGNNSSFAKLQLEIPKAFKVDSFESDSGRYMQNDSQVKYLWDRMPIKDTLHISFKAQTDPDFSGSRSINGNFSFIHNEEKQNFQIPTQVVWVGPKQVASTDEPELVATDIASATIEPSIEDPPSETEIPIDEEISEILKEVEAEPVVEAEPEEEIEQPVTEPVVAIQEEISVPEAKPELLYVEEKSEPVKDSQNSPKQPIIKKERTADKAIIEFRVQLIASAVKVDILQLKSKYAISEEVHSERHNRLWKYTAGSHKSYGDAKRQIPTYRNDKGVKGAFVTAYVNGVRIAVADAIKQTK